MAISFVAAASAGSGATTSSAAAAFTIPASAAIGDTAVVVIAQNSGINTYNGPTGWTQLRTDYAASNLAVSVFVKDMASGDPGSSATFTGSGSSRTPGLMLVYRGTSASGVAITAPTSSATTTNSITSPAVTTTADNSFVVALWAYRWATAAPMGTLTMPGTHTQDGNTLTAFTTSPNNGLYGSHLTTPGATGTYAAVTATAGTSNISTSLAYGLSLTPSTSSAFTGTLNTSGSGALTSAGTPGISGSEGGSGSSFLSFSGAPAITAALSLAGSSGLTLTGGAPVGGTLGLSGGGVLSLSGAGHRKVCRGLLAQRHMPVIPPLVALVNFSKAILRINGEWVEAEFPAAQQIEAADIYVPGGYETPVDDALADILTAAGYTVDTLLLE